MTAALLVLLWIVVISAAYAGFSAAPWVPTKPKECRNLLDAYPLKGNETVYDLGCGSRSMLFAIAKRYPHVKAIGYDISILPLCIGWLHKALHPKRYRNVHLHFGNLYKQDVSTADVIFMFLMQRAYPQLLTTLRRTIRPETTLALEAWPFDGIAPQRTLETDGCLPVHIYTGKQLQT